MRALALALALPSALALAPALPSALAHPDREVCPIGGTLESCTWVHEDTAQPDRSEGGVWFDAWMCCSYGANGGVERDRYTFSGTQYDHAWAGFVVYGTPTGKLSLVLLSVFVNHPTGAADPSVFACTEVHDEGPCQYVLS